jgi:hypothetical protein
MINYTETPDWDAKVRELVDGHGVDCIVETGGPGTIAMSLKALAVGGHVSLIGASLSSSGTGLDPLLLTGRGITLASISVGSRSDFEAMNRAIALHRLRPVIDRTFLFAEAKAAYRHFLGAFITEGNQLQAQAANQNSTLPDPAANEWATRVESFLIENIGGSYVARFRDATAVPAVFPEGVDDAHARLWRGIYGRLLRLEQFSQEQITN